MARFKKELIVFIGLFIFLTLGMHMKQWVSHPIEHLTHLSSSQFGLFHPLYFTFLVYAVLYFLRVIFGFILGLFRKKG